jgi:hypothetical protein
MGQDAFAYQFVFLLHLTLVVVGFGSSFVYGLLAVQARKLEPKESYAVNHAAFSVSKYLTTYPIYAAMVCGIALVVLSDKLFTFSQTWVSLAFVLSLIGILVMNFLLYPNTKAMDALQEKLASGAAKPGPDGGPPKEVAELQERGSKQGMYSGVLHLLFLLLMIDMIWKPFR